MAGRKPWRKTDHPDVPGESRTEGGRAELHIKIGPDVTVGSVQGSPKRSVKTPHVIPTGGQDYFIGVVHAHALGIIWMDLYVERSELEDDGRTAWTRQTKRDKTARE